MKEKESRTIYCPVCHRGRILDAASQTDPAHLRLFGPRQSAKAEWFTKCSSRLYMYPVRWIWRSNTLSLVRALFVYPAGISLGLFASQIPLRIASMPVI